MKKFVFIGAVLFGVITASFVVYQFFGDRIMVNELAGPRVVEQQITIPKPANAASQKVLKKPTVTLKPTAKVFPTSVPTKTKTTINTTATPAVSYQDYGWYTHDGKSMQYYQGNWFTTPQQANTPTPTPEPTLVPCPQHVPSFYCQRYCSNKSFDECRSNYKRDYRY